jgi:hypothetical protein
VSSLEDSRPPSRAGSHWATADREEKSKERNSFRQSSANIYGPALNRILERRPPSRVLRGSLRSVNLTSPQKENQRSACSRCAFCFEHFLCICRELSRRGGDQRQHDQGRKPASPASNGVGTATTAGGGLRERCSGCRYAITARRNHLFRTHSTRSAIIHMCDFSATAVRRAIRYLGNIDS